MQAPPMPEKETMRLQALYRLRILDTPAEKRFDRLTRLAQQMFGTQIALVSLVDAERQWFKSRQGLNACETGRDVSFCGHSILGDTLFEVEDASQDQRFADNPLVVGDPQIRFYAGAPLKTQDGFPIGTLCIIDSKPRRLTVLERQQLRDFADVVEDEINHQRERELQQQLDESSLRSQGLLEAIPDMVFVMDSEGYFLKAQERSDLLVPKEKLIGLCITEVMPPDVAAKTLEAIRQAIATGRVTHFETPLKMPEGLAWFEARFRSLNDREVLVIIRNITREKHRAEQLTTNERRLAGVLEGTRIGTWEWNIQTGETVFNERWAEIIGYSLDELAPVSIETWRLYTHPDDVVSATQLLEQHFSGALEFYDCLFRMRHKNGHWVWVRARGRVVTRTDDARPLIMYGTHADVTDEYQSRKQLERQNRALSLLNYIAFNLTGSLDDQLEQALRVGCEFLAADLGIVSEVIGETYIVSWFSALKGSELQRHQHFDLKQTYCDLALHNTDELVIEHMKESPYHKHPCYQAFGLEMYIGIALHVAGEVYGTVNFSAAEPRARAFDDTDRLFLRLLARWISGSIEQSLSVDKLNKLVEQVPGIIFQFRRAVDGKMSFLYASPGIGSIYEGVTPEQVRSDASIVFSKIYADDLNAIKESIELSARSLNEWRAQYRVEQSDGELRWVEGRSRPQLMLDGSILWHGYINDIHERKQAELALQFSENRLRGLFEFSPIGIALNDYETGQFVDLNTALLAPSGYTRDEFIQLSYWDITPQEYEPSEKKALEQLKAKGSYDPYEKEYIRKDGSRYPVRLQGILMKEVEGRQLIWTLVEDITERVKNERMKNEFVSTVSHELRTPLTSVSGSLSLIASGALGELPPVMREMVSIAQKNSKRLTLLINDLLDMDKLLSGNMRFELQQQPLAPLLEQCLQGNQSYADQYRITLSLQVPPNEVIVNVDTQRLEQVMANLLSNAIKFSPAGSQVNVVVVRDSAHVEISVIDCGVGIAEEFHEKIFQKFSQVDSSDTRGKGGTGLGLAITRELITRMNGTVGFESIVGEGSRFFIHLPIVERGQ